MIYMLQVYDRVLASVFDATQPFANKTPQCLSQSCPRPCRTTDQYHCRCQRQATEILADAPNGICDA